MLRDPRDEEQARDGGAAGRAAGPNAAVRLSEQRGAAAIALGSARHRAGSRRGSEGQSTGQNAALSDHIGPAVTAESARGGRGGKGSQE